MSQRKQLFSGSASRVPTAEGGCSLVREHDEVLGVVEHRLRHELLLSCGSGSRVGNQAPGGRQLPQLDQRVTSGGENILPVSCELNAGNFRSIVGLAKSGVATGSTWQYHQYITKTIIPKYETSLFAQGAVSSPMTFDSTAEIR